MIATIHPAIPPVSPVVEKPEPAFTRPLDPELSRSNLSMTKSSIENAIVKVNEAHYSISFIKDWAERSGTHLPLKKEYVEMAELSIVPHIQIGNTCGPTSLTMVLNAFDKKVSVSQVVKETRCSPLIGTSPIDIKNTALKFGLAASIVNEASPQAVINVLTAGGRCIAIVEQPRGLHYLVINGYRRDKDGNTEFLISDPNGSCYYQSAKQFSEKWDNASLRGFDIGIHRCIIAVSKEKIVAENFSGTPCLLSICHSFVNGLTALSTSLIGVVGTAFSFALRRFKSKCKHKKSAPSRERS